MTDNVSSTPNIQDSIQIAQTVYDSLLQSYLEENGGKYIAIDTNSKEYFVGLTREEAVKEAKKTHPESVVFVRRIGTVEKISSCTTIAFSNQDVNYACLL